MAATGVLAAVKTAMAGFCGQRSQPRTLLFAGAARTLAALFAAESLANSEEGTQVLRKVPSPPAPV